MTGEPEIAFVGRSNVGKSSLLNALAGSRKLARTGSTPGRTQRGQLLPGRPALLLRRPARLRLRQGEQGRPASDWAARVGELPPASARPSAAWWCCWSTARWAQLRSTSQAYQLPRRALGAAIVVAATKVDQVGRGERERQRASDPSKRSSFAESTPLISVSAHTGEGMNELWREIRPARRVGRRRTSDS